MDTSTCVAMKMYGLNYRRSKYGHSYSVECLLFYFVYHTYIRMQIIHLLSNVYYWIVCSTETKYSDKNRFGVLFKVFTKQTELQGCLYVRTQPTHGWVKASCERFEISQDFPQCHVRVLSVQEHTQDGLCCTGIVNNLCIDIHSYRRTQEENGGITISLSVQHQIQWSLVTTQLR